MSPAIFDVEEVRSVNDLDIEQWIHARFGFIPHPFWIGHCRELYLAEQTLEPRLPWHECPTDKRSAIKEAFIYFGMLSE